MKVLLTGANGQLGTCFQERLPEAWSVWATDTANLDITNQDSVLTAVRDFKPNIIVNAAAFTAVDQAETNLELANLVNNIGPKNLALAAKETHARLIHVSTDYVFDGESKVPYKELDETNPLSVYGRTKLDGEISTLEVLPQTIIVRTAWVFSEYGNNFLKTMLRLANERDALNIVSDQRGCPTYAGDIAKSIISLIQNEVEGGVYHYCGDKEVSWHGFAEEILTTAARLNKIGKIPSLNAITTEQYPTPARRPAFSTLDMTKIKKIGVVPSDWIKAINYILLKL